MIKFYIWLGNFIFHYLAEKWSKWNDSAKVGGHQ